MWSTDQHDVQEVRGRRFALLLRGMRASRGDVFQAWRIDREFRTWFNALLADSPYAAFRWETPAVTTESLDRPFEFVVLDAPSLERPADPSSFEEHFVAAPSDIAVFSNLSGDATLVVPTEQGPRTAYGHLGTFVRQAPPAQRDALWQAVGEAMARRISEQPVWLSTAGAGVPWLHVRLDDRAKYYGYRPYRQTP